ncbi:MAG: autotransporter domain-containing protein [Planctomycetaceae bacterium]|jgi:uncharacterized protein with beta-barrel porin domain|nr:autotransporter domain-containing protein [Planctomycetaceae bacterium]
MSKILTSAPLVTLLCVSLLLVRTANAETITYPGDPLRDPHDAIGTNAPSMSNSLFPGDKENPLPSNNTVTVNSGNVPGHVFGGLQYEIASGNESAGNKVIIKGGTIGTTASASGGNVTGGWSLAANVRENTVTIENGTIYHIIYGGWINGDGNDATFCYNATGNEVTIHGGTMRNNVYGAYSQEGRGTLSKNTVTIDGGNFTQNDSGANIITGAYSGVAPNILTGNSVTISGGTIDNYNVIGARGQASSQITANTVTISAGTIKIDPSHLSYAHYTLKAIYGGHLSGGNTSSIGDVSGLVSRNYVNITGGDIQVDVYGGYVSGSDKNNATENTVNISGGSVKGDIYGGYSTHGEATENSVTINGGTFSKNDGIIAGGYGSSSTEKNAVNIRGGLINNSSIYGGRGKEEANIGSNTVTITNGVIKSGEIYGGQSVNGIVTNNRVIIEGGIITADIYGGRTLGVGNVNSSTVTIKGGIITGDVYGGYGSDNHTVSGGNRLNIYADPGNIGKVQNFDYIYFDYDGDAGIGTLSTTSTGSDTGDVKLDVAENRKIIFEGKIDGSRDLTINGNGNVSVDTTDPVGTRTEESKGWIDFTNTINISSNLNINSGVVALESTAKVAGNTTVNGTDVTNPITDGTMLLMMRTDPTKTRALLDTKTFTLKGKDKSYSSAVLMGDGFIKAGTITINGGEDGFATLAPTSFDSSTGQYTAGTLTFQADYVNLNNFVLLYQVYGDQEKLELDTSGLVATSNNTLLHILGQGTNISIGTGKISFSTPFVDGPYLIIHAGKDFASTDTNGLTATINGVEINKGNTTPRGDYKFILGGNDSVKTADGNKPSDGNNNIWFTHSLNSLSMDWVGLPDNNTWDSAAKKFLSLQTTADGKQETQFLHGDKVYVSGDDAITIEVPNQVMVSGLVVGQNTAGIITDGDLIFNGEGGITADKTSAFGKYLTVTGTEKLTPTGKLEKYGTGTLTFENTGGNLFIDGVDIYGGTIAIDRGDQLQVGDGEAITFKDNNDSNIKPLDNKGTLLVKGIVELYADIAVEVLPGNVTPDTYAYFDVTEGNALLLKGTIKKTGDGDKRAWILKKGTGILQVAKNSQGIFRTEVKEGTFRVVDGVLYNSTQFVVEKYATLAGGGQISDTEDLTIYGHISPDSATLDANNMSITGDARYGTLTLQAKTSISMRGNVYMDFDIAADSDGKDTKKDLLVLKGDNTGKIFVTDMSLGTINFRGALSDNTEYLVIKMEGIFSFEGPTGINPNVLKATLNGVELKKEEEPRGGIEFWLGDDKGIPITPITLADGSGNIWMKHTINSLTMNWTSDGKQDVVWGHEATFSSLQTKGTKHTEKFQHGDEVFIYNENAEKESAITIILDADDALHEERLVSRLVVGAEATLKDGARDEVAHDGDVTITGTGYITAKGNSALGNYLATSTADGQPLLDVDNFGKLEKYGDGTLNMINTGTNTFEKGIFIYAGTLSGTTTLVGDTLIKGSATLKPDGLTYYDDANKGKAPEQNPLTIYGNLTFEQGSKFDVRIATAHAVDNGMLTQTPKSDLVKVKGNVTINKDAVLIVRVDDWGTKTYDIAPRKRFTIIEILEGNGTGTGEFGKLKTVAWEDYDEILDLGLQHGWNSTETKYLVAKPGDPYGVIGDTHNQREIGKTLDLNWKETNGIDDLLDYLGDLRDDADVCKTLDQFHGDLAANAMMMTLREPWRHPFNRMTTGCPEIEINADGSKKESGKNELWGELTFQSEVIGYDRNAHSFNVDRFGLVVGRDKRLSPYSIVGITGQYTNSNLRQATGKAQADDFAVGLYGMTRLKNSMDMKVYFGYSHQEYDLRRIVHWGKIDTFRSKTSGEAMSASVEVSKPYQCHPHVCLTPLTAWDFEHVWMSGYREHGSVTALRYDGATLVRSMFRIGLRGEYTMSEQLSLNSRLQYAAQLNNREHPAIGARFVSGPSDQYTADIWGSRIGRDYVNVGIGGNWRLTGDGLSEKFLYFNYDAKWFTRADIHVGEIGYMKKW